MNQPAIKRKTDRSSGAAGLDAEKPLFLREGLEIKEEETEVYDLTGEFEGTRKNKSIPVHVAIICFAIILLAATVWFTGGIQDDIDRMTVGIEDFKDINLEELLNSLNRARDQLGRVDETIAGIKLGMQKEIDRIRTETETEIRKVERSGLGLQKKRELIQQLKDEEERKLNASQKKYETSLKEKETEADTIRSRMADYEKQVQGEKEKYSREIDGKLKAFKKASDDKAFAAVKVSSERESLHEAQMNEQKKRYDELMNKYRKDMSKSGTNERLLNNYRAALIYYAKTRGEHGMVIERQQNGELLVILNPFVNIKEENRAFVLNQSNKVVATVLLYRIGDQTMARVTGKTGPEGIKPFDKILLKKQ